MSHPALRLVREVDIPREKLTGMTAVARENQSAARLTAANARLILAEATAAALDGGRSAILAPERRQRVLALAGTIGVRAFDANLVIAVVQDRVRRGENWREWIGGTEQNPDSGLTPHELRTHRAISHTIVAALLGAMIAGCLMAWLLGGA